MNEGDRYQLRPLSIFLARCIERFGSAAIRNYGANEVTNGNKVGAMAIRSTSFDFGHSGNSICRNALQDWHY